MSFEQKVEKRLAHLEGLILARLARMELGQESRFCHLEEELQRLTRHVHHQQHEIDALRRLLRPHHYPRTTAIAVKPA